MSTPRESDVICACVPTLCKRTVHTRVAGGTHTESQLREPDAVAQSEVRSPSTHARARNVHACCELMRAPQESTRIKDGA
jgi:hypothetical protein